MTMRIGTIVSAALLAAAACMYLVVQTRRTESPPMAAVEPPVADVELAGAVAHTAAEVPATEARRRSPVAEEPPDRASAAVGMKVLRVVLAGVLSEGVQLATVTLTAVDERGEPNPEIKRSWPCQGLTSGFDLAFLEVAEGHEGLRVDELEVEVDHPHHPSEKTRVPLSHGVEQTNGKTVYEVLVRLVRPEYWPEFTLAVLDAHTREHLDDIELLSGPGMSTFMWGRNPVRSFLADGLSSPVRLMGGRDVGVPEDAVPYLALRPAADESPRLVKIGHYMSPGNGSFIHARVPGYAWGSIALDLSKSEPRELLLKPGAAIEVRLTNVQLERYRSLETKPMVCVQGIASEGDNQFFFEPLDETLETEGLRIDGLKLGGYRVFVELDGGAWAKRPVLAREELTLTAGETGEVMLALADPPAPPDRVTLGGVVSFPDFDGVRLQLYKANWENGVSHVELSLTEMVRVGGALPTWGFQIKDVPVGTCQGPSGSRVGSGQLSSPSWEPLSWMTCSIRPFTAPSSA